MSKKAHILRTHEEFRAFVDQPELFGNRNLFRVLEEHGEADTMAVTNQLLVLMDERGVPQEEREYIADDVLRYALASEASAALGYEVVPSCTDLEAMVVVEMAIALNARLGGSLARRLGYLGMEGDA